MNFLKSTILSKIVMAFTGVILVMFIFGHALGNMQIFLGKETYNTYAHFLQSLGEILWIIRIFLFVCVVLHVITSIKLKFHNMSAKPVNYQVKNYVKAKLNSRTMIWTGLMILAFLLYHLLHFTVGVTNPSHYNQHEVYVNKEVYGVMNPQMIEVYKQNPNAFQKEQFAKVLIERHDVYAMVVSSFSQPLISLIYIVGVVLLGFHLAHAIQSMFQTLGLNNPKYFPTIISLSNLLSIVIVLCMISIPINVLLGVIGANV